MSYASVAASGPHQSPEEARAPAMPEVQHTDDSTHSLIDVDSPHISSVPSDYESQSVKTDTQAERLEHEAEDREKQAEAKARQAKAEATKKAEKAKEKAGIAGKRMKENADNPVVIGNMVTVGLLGSLLGFGAYKKYVAAELTWKVASAWAGIAGLFGVADYYVSNYFFQKYPPKK